MNLKLNIFTQMHKAKMKNWYELCEKIGITYETMRRIHKRNDCKVSILFKISEVLNCDVSDLIKNS